MESKKISEQNIEDLYKFTRKHFVEYYDVQTELVDHLANDIEQIWLEQSHLSFQQARDKSFKKFGVFGFMDVVEAKQKQMNRKYWKIIWRFAKEWFAIPKIIITATAFLLFFITLKIKYSNYILLSFLFVLIVFEAVFMYKNRKKHKQKTIKKDKVFLLESMIKTTQNSYTVLTLTNLFNTVNLVDFNFTSLENHWLLLISLVMTLLGVLFYVSNYVIPQRAEELLEEHYPEYKIIV